MRLRRCMSLIVCFGLMTASTADAMPSAPPHLCLLSQCVDLTTSPIFEVPITITGTGTLAAFGFQLSQSHGIGSEFTLVDIIPGPLIAGWTHVEGADAPNLGIRVGGYNVTPTPLDGTETLLVTLRLRSRGNTTLMTLGLGQLTDDIATATSCTATIRRSPAPRFPSGHIVFYPEGQPGECCFPAPDGMRLQVIARPDAHIDWPVRGASFRIQVSPPAPGATFTWSPAPGVQSSAGDPVDNTATMEGSGVQVLLAQCVTGPFRGTEFPLGTITVNDLTGVHTLELQGVDPTHPSALASQCAYFLPCEYCLAPNACITQVDRFPVSYRAVVNSPACDETCGALVGIAAVDWGRVKALYR